MAMRALLVLIVTLARGEDYDEEFSYVTCGSAVKLKHKQTSYYLYSAGVNYGSGSGQQVVTAIGQ